MVQIDILPRVLPDSFFDTMEEAFEEADRRNGSSSARNAVTRISESPYGGYIVHSVLTEAFIRAVSNPSHPLAAASLRQSREAFYE